MPCSTPCSNCDRKGLPILFTRYAAAYSAQDKGMAALRQLRPMGQFQVNPNGVALQTALYGVRMLRAGYLYLYVERVGFEGWLGFIAHPHGYLSQFHPMFPEGAKANPACEVEFRGANNSMVWIEDAKRVKKLWFMFHPDPIDAGHLLLEIQPNLAKYMQRFDVAGWANGNTSQPDACQPEQLNGQVMEFAALKEEAVQTVGNEQHYGMMGTTYTERAWGNYEEQRNGKHFESVRHETRQPNGTFLLTDTGPVRGMMKGPYVAIVTQPTYKGAQGPRLNKIADFLIEKKGAVVACEDPIGIAQELSMHHLTAAIPYVAWLNTTDKQGVSNKWKQAVSESVRTVEKALAKNLVQAYDDATDRLRDNRDLMASGNYPGGSSFQTVPIRRPDGSVENISVQELNRRRVKELNERVGARESDRTLLGVKGSNSVAQTKVDAFCDRTTIAAFDTAHLGQLKDRDALMDKIAADLQQWLKAGAFLDKALGRYNEDASIDSGDGIRCAGQLKGILEQIASAPKGREWYASIDPFAPAKKNLVWRVLSLNNTAISQELNGALAPLTRTAMPGEVRAQEADANAENQKAWTALSGALTKVTKTLSAADKIGKEFKAIGGERKPGTGSNIDSYFQIGKAVYDGPLGILFVALVAYFKNMPATQREVASAKAQALTLSYGLGREATTYVQMQQAIANESLGRHAKSAEDFDKALRKRLPKAAATEAASMRLNYVQFGLAGLALLPALGNIGNRADGARATVELAGSYAGLVGGFRQLQADRYEKFVFNQIPNAMTRSAQEPLTASSGQQLLRLKATAARYVVAGALVVVWLDAVDGRKARQESEIALSYAYFGRTAAGIGTMATTIAAARSIKPILWLSRANIALALLTGILTEVIGALKGDAWANWLQAGPFRKHESTKIPYKTEAETIDKLADALAEI